MSFLRLHATGIFVVKLPKCLSKLIGSAYVQPIDFYRSDS